MINMLIVDDEFVVRHGIRYSIPWESYGITVVGEADNGKNALKKAIQTRPDLVICDIKMPGEDGIAFIHNLQKIMPQVSVVMLTGYSNQEYMLEAIRTNVCDYLMKPATMEQILETVLRIKSKIEASRLEQIQSQKRDKFLDENIEMLRQKFIERLLSGKVSIDKLSSGIQALDIPLHGPQYAIILAISKKKESGSLVQECTNAFSHFCPVVIYIPENKTVVSILNLEKPLVEEELDKISQQYFANSENLCGALAVSQVINDLLEFSSHYDNISYLLNRGIWYDNGSFLHEGALESRPFPEEEINELERRLFDSIHEGFPNTITECAENLFDKLVESRPDFPIFLDKIVRIEEAIHMIWGSKNSQADNLGMDINKIREHFILQCSEINLLHSKYGTGQVGRALRFIEQNFNRELTLESVASVLYISPTYLSRLLKEKTNMGYHSWLRYFRIQKAKQLLANTSEKHYQIAELVGYSSYKIFSKHFQQVTEITAKEYRIQFGNNGIRK